MGTIYVNKSGKSWNVSSGNGTTDTVTTIRPNDVFAWTNGWNGNAAAGTDYQGVYIRGKRGWTTGMTGTKAFTPIKNCGKYKIDIEGKNCAVFQTRRPTAYYNSSGAKMGTMPTGCYLATQSGTAGQSNPGLMYVDFWGVGDPTNRNVFVDVGIGAGQDPSFNSINLVGA